jgi:hypothetical protein
MPHTRAAEAAKGSATFLPLAINELVELGMIAPSLESKS